LVDNVNRYTDDDKRVFMQYTNEAKAAHRSFLEHSRFSSLVHEFSPATVRQTTKNVTGIWALVLVAQEVEAPLFTGLPHSSLLDDHGGSNSTP
jgi:hypothetical protein